MMGNGFDGRFVKFLRISYADVKQHVLAGESDEDVIAWCRENGRELTDEDILVFNSFMSKRGWRDDEEFGHNEQVRIEYGVAGRDDILTDFDLIEADEERPIDRWKEVWDPDRQ